jgi:hypothetical protein
MVEGRHKEVVLSKGDDAAAACISLTTKDEFKMRKYISPNTRVFMYVQVRIKRV